MTHENDKRNLRTVRDKDFEKLKELRRPILSLAVANDDYELVKFLIDNGSDSGDADENGDTALHIFFRKRKIDGNDDCRLRIFDILLAGCSNVVETVFSMANSKKMTPFLFACVLGCGEIITRFLALLGNTSIPLDHFIGYEGNNVFHLLFCPSTFFSLPSLADIVRALLDKIPILDQLTDAKDDGGWSPLHQLVIRSAEHHEEVNEIAKIFFRHGASPDIRNHQSLSYLDSAICKRNKSLVEILLRAGCSTQIFGNRSPLSMALRNGNQQSIPIVELLLAFGYDLKQELYLYTIDERPSEFNSPQYAARRDTSDMEPDVLEALQKLRRSNKMLSLQRQCRNTIRRHFKGNADEVIQSLTCIPDRIKSYLLVENEKLVLDLSK